MRIGICDDEKFFRDELKAMCHRYFEKKNEKAELIPFSSLSALYHYRESLDLIFLDIEFSKAAVIAKDGRTIRIKRGGESEDKKRLENGIQLMECFQQIQKNALIIFVTQHESLMPNAFGKNVIGFLSKPVQEMAIHSILSKAVNISRMEIVVKLGVREYLGSSHIRYISGQHVYTKLYRDDDNSLIVRTTLKEWETKLSNFGFVRVSKSYLVNLAFVEQMEKGKVYLSDLTVTMGRNYRASAEEAYDQYKKKMAVYY